jgi:drug/metabolite transporter (DMT)-like permease
MRRPAADPLALVLAPAASVAIGCVPFVTVGLYQRGFDAASVMFWRAFFAVAVVAGLALALRTPFAAAWRAGGKRMFTLALTVGTAQTWCYFFAIGRLPTSVVILLFFLYPLVTIVLQRIFLGVPVTALALAAGTLILLGAGLTGSGTLALGGVGAFDLALALVPPFTYAAYAVALSRQVGALPAVAGAVFIQLGALAGFGVLVALFGLRVPDDADSWSRVVAVGVFGTAFYTVVLAYALPRLGATFYAILSSVELVTVVLLGVALLGERLTVVQWSGVALVLAGILLYRPARGTG